MTSRQGPGQAACWEDPQTKHILNQTPGRAGCGEGTSKSFGTTPSELLAAHPSLAGWGRQKPFMQGSPGLYPPAVVAQENEDPTRKAQPLMESSPLAPPHPFPQSQFPLCTLGWPPPSSFPAAPQRGGGSGERLVAAAEGLRC